MFPVLTRDSVAVIEMLRSAEWKEVRRGFGLIRIAHPENLQTKTMKSGREHTERPQIRDGTDRK